MSGSSDAVRWESQRAALTKYIQSKLLVRQLQTILKKLALPVSGLKMAQQARLVEQVEKVIANRNEQGLQQLKRLIYNPDSNDSKSSPDPTPSKPAPRTLNFPGHYPSPSLYDSPAPSPVPPTMAQGSSSQLNFYPSPFYTIHSQLTTIQGLQAFGTNTAQQRHVVTIPLLLTPQTIEEIRLKGLRTILYCALIEGSATGPHHVAFPQQIEIRVNNKAVSANLRGIKNKPGTTRPLDITEYIEKSPVFKNNILITYALSQKRYLANIKLVRKSTPDELVAQIKRRPHISKQNVIDRLRKENEDEDIVATSTVMSLKCPASILRISTPIRSTACRHNQCYDAISFLQLQEQAPTWACPVCNKKIEFDHLAVDKYVEEILNSVPESVESVTIDPMGNWTIPEKKSPSPGLKDEYSDDSEDDIQILDLDKTPSTFKSASSNIYTTPMSASHHSTTFPRPNFASTPKSLSSEPPAAAARPNGGSSNKRPAPVTIDLTLSDDDDDGIRPRPSKRLQTTSVTPAPNSIYPKPTHSTSSAGPFVWSNGFSNY